MHTGDHHLAPVCSKPQLWSILSDLRSASSALCLKVTSSSSHLCERIAYRGTLVPWKNSSSCVLTFSSHMFLIQDVVKGVALAALDESNVSRSRCLENGVAHRTATSGAIVTQ